ncbi:MAG: SURF1 family cytochrome oxidase biogenesis protein [Nocardioidaceae bacterium]
MRFLLSRRWILFFLAVVGLAYGCWWLGTWQFHRLAETKASNAQITHNLKASPLPVDKVLAVGRPLPTQREWRRVTATGTYVPSRSVVVRYQTRNSQSGVDIVTPLRTVQGPAVLVDRGWFATDNIGHATVTAPPPPQGQVTVVGYARVDGTGDAAVVTDRSTRAISSATIAPTLPFQVYGGFVDAQSESPKPATSLVKAELPDLGNGPHFFYGLQWWFFGVLAVFGFFYLMWDERRKLLGLGKYAAREEPAKPAEPERAPSGSDNGVKSPH